jgi:hypothetical protein
LLCFFSILCLYTNKAIYVFVAVDEILGMAFGGCVTLFSIWLAYQLAIKPERQVRRERAEKSIEDLHRRHWQQLKRALQARPRNGKPNE